MLRSVSMMRYSFKNYMMTGIHTNFLYLDTRTSIFPISFPPKVGQATFGLRGLRGVGKSL
jgi:hypothetical protein